MQDTVSIEYLQSSAADMGIFSIFGTGLGTVMKVSAGVRKIHGILHADSIEARQVGRRAEYYFNLTVSAESLNAIIGEVKTLIDGLDHVFLWKEQAEALAVA